MLPVISKSITLTDDASMHPQKAIVSLYADLKAKNQSAVAFNILVNNADFYSGTCYNDGGTTAWGDLNKRGSESDPGSVWKWVTYNFKNGGADPVLKKLDSLSTDSVTDISSKLSTYANQTHGVTSNGNDLSEYDCIVLCATYQQNKTGDFTSFAGCECLIQAGWHAQGSSSNVVESVHLCVLKNITGAINIYGNSVGTGGTSVRAFGFK